MAWRSSSSASGSRDVTMPILASRSTTWERSIILPSTRIASAALARPGPIADAISAPLTGLSNCRTEPSGKEILIMTATE